MSTINELPARTTLADTDVFAVDTGSVTNKTTLLSLASALAGTMFKTQTVSVENSSQAANSMRTVTVPISVPSGYSFFTAVVTKAANNGAITLQKRDGEVGIRITIMNLSSSALETGGDVKVIYIKN